MIFVCFAVFLVEVIMLKAAAIFPGQGAQKKNMFMHLYDEFDEVKHIFNVASSVLGRDLISIIKNGDNLNMTENTQPCVLACDIASWELLSKTEVTVDYVAGYSLGEFAALYAAGCVELEDVFRVIDIRSKAMANCCEYGYGAMAAIMCKNDKLNDVSVLIQQFEKVWISNINTDDQITVSGEYCAINSFCEKLSNMGVESRIIKVSSPFHCPLMKGALEQISDALNSFDLKKPQIPIVMNLSGKIETDVSKIKENLIQQTIMPVQWKGTMLTLYEENVRHFIECGPGYTLSNFVNKMIFSDIKVSKILEPKN